jgi:predicted Zn-dependent peptidase
MELKGIKRMVLDNGLTLLMEKRGNEEKKTAIFVGVKSGSIHESERLNGGSHFNEHLLFKTNKYKKAQEISETIEWAGGYLNAYTEWLSTTFFIKALPEGINEIIQVTFEASVNYEYDLKEFDLERGVILTEIKNKINNPGTHAFWNLFVPILFRETLLEKTVTGTVKSMGNVTKQELQSFKKECYVPQNMAVVISGIFDEKEVIKKIKNTFGKIEPRAATQLKLEVNLDNSHFEKFEKRQGIDQAYLGLGYRLPGYRMMNLKELFAIEMLTNILDAGLSSRLFKELRVKRGIGYGTSAIFLDVRESSLFGININGFNPSRIRESEEVILGEFNKLKNEPVPDREFEGIKNYVISQHRDQAKNIVYRAHSIWDNEIRRTPYDFRHWEKHLKAVTKKDVMEAARKYLTSNYTLTALVPEESKI